MAPVNATQTTLTVTALGASGDGLAVDAEGARWVVAGALPGDVVHVRGSHTKNGLHFAERMEIVTPSTDRVQSYCRVAACGGCVLRSYGDSVNWKRQELVRVLERAGVPPDKIGAIEADGQLGYRHRARLHRKKQRIGYFAESSHHIVSFDVCKVLHPRLDERLQQLQRAIATSDIAGEIEAMYSPDDGRFAIEVVLDKGSNEATAQQTLRSLVAGRIVDGAILVSRKNPPKRYGEPYVLLRHPMADAAKFFLEPGVFSQANILINQRLVRSVSALVPNGAKVLELHAGAGNLTLGYAAHASHVVASEWDEQAVLCLRRNVEVHGAAVTVVKGSDAETLASHRGDVLVMDPPRTGAKIACERLATGSQVFGRIVYVSCDAGTLARDLRTLSEKYEVKLVTPLDMFFGTPHIEAVTLQPRGP